MNENLIHFFQQRPEVFPLRHELDVQRFLQDAIVRPLSSLPAPAKIYLEDELQPQGYGFPLIRSAAFDELAARLDRWIADEIAARATDTISRKRADDSFQTYRTVLVKFARNAVHSSILADYHAAFWLAHSQQLARAFGTFSRSAGSASGALNRDQADLMKYRIFSTWSQKIRDSIPEIVARTTGTAVEEKSVHFLQMLLENPLIATEDFVSSDLHELKSYFAGQLRRDLAPFRKWFDELRARIADVLAREKLFRRAISLLGYPESSPALVTALDRRVQQLIFDHPSWRPVADQPMFESISRRLLEFLIIHHLRRGILWLTSNGEAEHIGEESKTVYSRAIRPMNFGRRGVVEPIVHRFGLVYDITSFTQSLGEIARGGREEEHSAYRQMLEFQRDLTEITKRHGLQFEKFLGDGAFYTARQALRTVHSAIELQDFYSRARARGFAFNKGMRLALNYGYYRLLPMQISDDGTEIMEFYGPGIVELSRLTTGKATKEIEDIQHLLLSHGYDQLEVLKFFAPLSRNVDMTDASLQHREFYAYVNANGHLVNEGIVVSIPFLKQLSSEIADDRQKLYRLRTSWDTYVGFPSATTGSYAGIRILGSVSLKGIGNVDVGEIARFTHSDAEISLIDDDRPLIPLLDSERNLSAARGFGGAVGTTSARADLVVCQSQVVSGTGAVILVGEWDPVSGEVRRPIRIDQSDAERFGLATPLTVENVESQSRAYQNLYEKLSRLETLPSFSVQAIRENVNFNGFIIGETVERL